MKHRLLKYCAITLEVIFSLAMILSIRISKDILLGDYIFQLLSITMGFNKIIVATIVLGGKYLQGVICKKYDFKEINEIGDKLFKYLVYIVVLSTLVLFI